GPKPTPSARQAQAPEVAQPQTPTGESITQTLPQAAARPAVPGDEKVIVETDVFRAEIGLVGGDIQLVDLLRYPVSKDKPNEPVRLLNPAPDQLFVTQSGFLGDERIAPRHTVPWQAQAREYVMEGQKSLRVPLVWRGEGVEITKTYVFTPGSYEIGVEYQIRNLGNVPWTARQYGQLKRKRPPKQGSAFIRTFTGVACHTTEDPYEKYSFDDLEELPRNWETEGGWCAMVQHYFLAAWLPPEEQINHFYTKPLPGKIFIVGSYSPEYRVNPGETRTIRTRYYIGPKLQDVLETVAPGLELTVDYGIFTFIAQPIFWLMAWFHKFFGNWGWAIIATTFVIKAIFFPLSAASYKSMAKMRKLQPKMQALKERFGDDKQKFHQALMQLYREERVNPLGGCLPILVQIPVFISLYWVLVESVELRQAEFVLWLTDLTSKDPYFILPLLMGVTMWIQQKLSPPPTDPVQAQVMKMFPVIFTVFFAFFPAGLVLYWVVNNTLSIFQQWWINKQIEGSAKA
ncbi:MAG TPA: membrane protein insertase YidC, partial [Methylothermaceae bacterium]|nr:membrane protein insertase YidC [Methylothermaceae bacterium]